jgi:hypothetical protein
MLVHPARNPVQKRGGPQDRKQVRRWGGGQAPGGRITRERIIAPVFLLM